MECVMVKEYCKRTHGPIIFPLFSSPLFVPLLLHSVHPLWRLWHATLHSIVTTSLHRKRRKRRNKTLSPQVSIQHDKLTEAEQKWKVKRARGMHEWSLENMCKNKERIPTCMLCWGRYIFAITCVSVQQQQRKKERDTETERYSVWVRERGERVWKRQRVLRSKNIWQHPSISLAYGKKSQLDMYLCWCTCSHTCMLLWGDWICESIKSSFYSGQKPTNIWLLSSVERAQSVFSTGSDDSAEVAGIYRLQFRLAVKHDTPADMLIFGSDEGLSPSSVTTAALLLLFLHMCCMIWLDLTCLKVCIYSYTLVLSQSAVKWWMNILFPINSS